MQHRVQVGARFYSVTVIQEAERDWVAMAEVGSGWLVQNSRTREGALKLWQAAAEVAEDPSKATQVKSP